MIFDISDWKFSYSCENTMQDFRNAPRKICIAAHSMPYFEGILLYHALTYLGLNSEWNRSCPGVLSLNPVFYVSGLGISPYVYDWCMHIPNGGGFIKRECKSLENVYTFCRVMFPSGGNITWKTGFYILAKTLNAKIVIMGIDYKTKQVIIDSVIDPLDSFEKTKSICITRLRKYEAGPFCYILRVLCGYGCETYLFDEIHIWIFRCSVITLFLYSCYFVVL